MLEVAKVNDLMVKALLEASDAGWENEVPVGAIVVDANGSIVARASNFKEKSSDVSGHAEIRALKEAGSFLGDWRLKDCSLIVTLEPCTMCLSAVLQSRIKNVYFGAYDSKGGALSLGYFLHKDSRLNHQFNVVGGFMHYECGQILSSFFKNKREGFSYK